MSYIRTKETYAYPDGEGGLVINTNRCVDQNGIRSENPCEYRYLIQLPEDEWMQMVREIVQRIKPEWATPEFINKIIQKKEGDL